MQRETERKSSYLGIGFVESSANNLVYEWFAEMESAGDIGKAIGIQGRVSEESEISNNNANNNNNNEANESETTGFGALVSMGLFQRHQVTAVYASEDENGSIIFDASDEAAEKTLFLKEFGHISARLM